MIKKKSQFRLLVIVMAGLIVLGAIVFPHERLLLERATDVVVTIGWGEPMQPDSGYQWLSETTIFGMSNGKAFLYDISTRAKQPLSKLNERLPGVSASSTTISKLSPDGKWLLWTRVTATNKQDIQAARLDGTGFQTASLPPPASAVDAFTWESDSRHWLATGCPSLSNRTLTNVLRGDVTAPGKLVSLPLSARVDLVSKSPDIEGYEDARWLTHEVPGALGRGTVVTGHAPRDTVVEVEQSNGGKRLAWLLVSSHDAPFAPWLDRMWPQYFGTRMQTELWLSNRNGSDMHEVGHCVYSQLDGLEDLRWLPSDREISFRCHGSLWMVPAE